MFVKRALTGQVQNSHLLDVSAAHCVSWVLGQKGPKDTEAEMELQTSDFMSEV